MAKNKNESNNKNSGTLPPLPEKIRNNDCQSAHAYDILVPESIV